MATVSNGAAEGTLMDPAENPSFPQGVGGMDLPIPTQHASDLIIDDWLAPSFNASELTGEQMARE